MTGFRDKNLELLIKETRSSTDEQLSASIGYIPEEFEPSKVDLLRKLFSNLDKPIFFFPYIGILSGAIGSMSSRAIGSLRKITSNLMDKNETFSTGLRELNIPDLINLLGENFFSRVFSGYGDDSIAQMVPAALVAENVSMFQAMRFLHHRTLAGIEKSTRYRRYDKRGSDGNYLYIVDNLIKAAGLEGHFRATIDKAFDIYSSLCDQKEGKGKLVIEGIKEKILPFGVFREEVRKALENKSDRQADDSELLEAYDKTIRAMHLDTIRHALPLATSTLLALEVNSQNIRDIMFAGYSTPTAESVAVTELLRRESAKYAGPLIADVDPGSPDEKIRSRTLDAILYKHNTGFLGRDIKYRIDRSNLYYREGEEKGFGLYRIQHCHGFVRVIDDLFGFEVEVSTKD
ncbi:MAG: FAD-dependent thymidylate synthase, partial [Nanoarchaeota archaeon]